MHRNADLEREAASTSSAAAAASASAVGLREDESWFMEAACCRDINVGLL